MITLTRTEDRPQVKLLRVLRLIDRMAGLTFPKTIKELHGLMNDEYRCGRTLYRDVKLLETMGIVHDVGSRPNQAGFGPVARLYLINLNRSEHLQRVALEVIDGGAQ